MYVQEFMNDPLLGRPLTWAEQYLLGYMNSSFIERLTAWYEPVGWPSLLIHYVMRPLLKYGYVHRPFSYTKSIYELTNEGRQTLIKYYPGLYVKRS